MTSMFDRIRAGLAKTAQQIRERLGAEPAATVAAPTVPGRAMPTDTLEAIEDALLSADVGMPATQKIIETVKNDRTNPSGTLGQRVAQVVKRILLDVRAAPAITTTP